MNIDEKKCKEMIDELNCFLNNLSIKAKCISAKSHRNMAFYDLQINPGTKIKQIQSFTPELALLLKSKTNPIVKPMPELGIVRLQVAHGSSKKLSFESCYNYNDTPKDNLVPFLFGETDEGNKLWVDMSKNPHMLVAGATGSGKSTFLHLLIHNIKLLNKNGYRIDLFLSDPKSVEFSKYKNNNNYNFVRDISNDYKSTVDMLKNIQELMTNRYSYFSKLGISSVEQLPNYFKKYFVIIDEASYFMMHDKRNKNFENLIVDLAQRSRAAGVYLILATQRPSTDVITGLIKANFPARLACKVSSKTDSNVIIDSIGAECLLGRGDAILKNYENDFTRLQIACLD